MIFVDNQNFPVEEHLDGGDSSMRAGIAALTNLLPAVPIREYETSWGMLTRHPTQPVWRNRLNFTRDQLIPMVAGLNAKGCHDVIRRLFVMHILRLGFCQDFQRDKIGTWKRPYPTTYVNDQGLVVSKSFDFADPLLPNHWWVLIRGGHLWPLYTLYPLCFFFALLSMYGSRGTGTEQNQVVSELSLHGKWMTRLYTIINPQWNINNYEYWQVRNEQEYAESIEQWVKSRL